MASLTLLLPLPFGPTTTLIPFLNFNTVFSGKVLNPKSSKDFKITLYDSLKYFHTSFLDIIHKNTFYFNTSLKLALKLESSDENVSFGSVS